MKLNRLAVFVLLILAVEISPPVPWINVGAASQSATQEEKASQGKKAKSTLPISVDLMSQSVIPKDGTQPIAPKDKEQSEAITRITAMPPVFIADKSKSLWDYVFDWGPWFFAAILVIVGIAGVRYAKHTLDAIKRQADIMDRQATDAQKSGTEAALLAKGTMEAIKEQAALMKQQVGVAEQNAAAIQKVADAAKMNAEITMAVQRPVVKLWNIGFNLGRDPFPDNTPITGDAYVVVTVRNHGLTRAVNVIATGKLVIGGNVRDVVSPIPYDLTPSNDIHVTFDPLNVWLPPEMVIPIQRGAVSVQVNLHVVYADEFGRSHEMGTEAILRNWAQRQWEIRPWMPQ